MNFDFKYENPEYNWLVGFGSKIKDIEWSVSYIRGAKKQGMNKLDGVSPEDHHKKFQILQNRMLMVNLSYPLWKF